MTKLGRAELAAGAAKKATRGAAKDNNGLNV
jgi:hypothetical protein